MKYSFFILLLVILASCVKDKPQDPEKSLASFNADTKVLVVNEGPFNTGHGSISIYDPPSGAVIEDYYTQQNNNAVLGNICQSMIKYNNSYYIVNNNSNSITVVKATDFIKTATISGFNSPRYVLPITYNKAYVSDLFQNGIAVVNLNTNVITSSIPCRSGTEQMVMLYNKAFVTNWRTPYCYVINTVNDVITDSVFVGLGASSCVIDKNAKLWVLSRGNSTTQFGSLTRINPITLQVELSLAFTIADAPNNLCINKTKDTLYYLKSGVYQFPIINASLPSSALINQGTKVFYGISINPKDYTIYVSDAIDYIQKSKIEIYKTNGAYKDGFYAGIISNGFVFE